MKIEECDELRSFEAPPTEVRVWFALVRYGESFWANGPIANDKQKVIEQLSGGYRGVTMARIYSAVVPVSIASAEAER
jgi:hypothetical protein